MAEGRPRFHLCALCRRVLATVEHHPSPLGPLCALCAFLYGWGAVVGGGKR